MRTSTPIRSVHLLMTASALSVFLFSACGFVEERSVSAENEERGEWRKNYELSLSELTAEELVSTALQSSGDTLRIVAVGHIYHLLGESEVYPYFVHQVNSLDADAIVLLGDVVRDNQDAEWAEVSRLWSGIEGDLFFTPGNHDINFYDEREQGVYQNRASAEQRYLQKVGYRYKLVQSNQANLLLLNACDTFPRFRHFLLHADQQLNRALPTLVFSHQDLWNRAVSNPQEVKRTWSYRSFPPDSVLPYLPKTELFVSGDYRLDFLKDSIDIGGTWVPNVLAGNRAKGDPLYVTIIEVVGGLINVYPHQLPLPETVAWSVDSL